MNGAERHRLKGKTLVVTGIGLTTPRRLPREGATVIVTHSREASRSFVTGSEFVVDGGVTEL